MTDMSQTIVARSDQLNADDLLGGPRTVRITKVTIKANDKDQPASVFYDGDDGKPYKPNKSMRRVMVRAWGTDSDQYTGRSMTLFHEPSVKWAGKEVGGIQISHMSHIQEPINMAITIARGLKKPYTVLPLQSGQGGFDPDGLLDEAHEIVRSGVDAYKDWFLSQTKDARSWLSENGHHDRLKTEAQKPAPTSDAHDSPPSQEVAAGTGRKDEGGQQSEALSSDDIHPAERMMLGWVERLQKAESVDQIREIEAEMEPHNDALDDLQKVTLSEAVEHAETRLGGGQPAEGN